MQARTALAARSATSAGCSSGTKCPQSGTISTDTSSASSCGAVEQHGGDGRVAVAEHDPRRHAQASARAARDLAREERPVQAHAGPRAGRLGQHRGEGPQVVGREGLTAHGARHDRALDEARVGDQPPAEQRRGDRDLIAEAPELAQLAGAGPAAGARGSRGPGRPRSARARPGRPGSRSRRPSRGRSGPPDRARARRARRAGRRPASACRSARAARRTSRSRAGRSSPDGRAARAGAPRGATSTSAAASRARARSGRRLPPRRRGSAARGPATVRCVTPSSCGRST